MQISSRKYIKFSESANYDSSAKLTGAGLGMKSHNNRNFEAGILSDDISIILDTFKRIIKIIKEEEAKQHA